ncbi:5'-3' exoribonuclease 2 [Aphelenchoides avenae]|nr:5'-3' exoribonuclease 2 [Aphelenchus avenae]
MGVPAFFRWLSRKYPNIIVNAHEEKPVEVDGVKVPVDSTKPNPNYQEFDNLYLDMNGIIHPCTHPEDRPAPKTEDEMFVLIFEYIDRLFSIVRPRRVLYMAIDGVAPRAKMNQQRSRRFRASKEAAEKKEEILSMRKKLEAEGVPLPPPRKEEEHFDSNCITPGTPFMARLAVALRYYVHQRITNDPAWQNIQVILSDANAPGEGEHKIMDYIRRQRASPSHDPNTVHCLCGADADLIMLGLATHEANFNIIREEFLPNQPRPCELCGQYGHELKNCQGLAKEDLGPDLADPLKKEKNFVFIRLPVLREYLERDLAMPNLPFEYDFERVIDDWVLLCFFVGNDFLPHLPSLEIREGAIDRLVKLYKNMVYQCKGWLTQDGDVNLDQVEMILVELGKAEDEIFISRQAREVKYRENNKARRRRERAATAPVYIPRNQSLIAPLSATPSYMSGSETRAKAATARKEAVEHAEANEKLQSLLRPAGKKRHAEGNGGPAEKSFKAEYGSEHASKEQNGEWTKATAKNGAAKRNGDSDSEEEPADDIRLYQEGWKNRYYQAKFGVSESDAEFRRKVAHAYVEGIIWTYQYYYRGCPSWTWYYPYHYAPFASDFDTVSQFKPNFSESTRPFKPLEQLMGVFPAASREHVPEGWRYLMTDSGSEIIDFYPPDFDIDLNGKKFAWQGVALLPFVDEKRLLTALDKVYDTLSDDERARNIRGPDRLFVGKRHPLFSFLVEVYESGKQIGFEKKYNENGELVRTWTVIDPKLANGMAGEICWDDTAVAPGETYRSLFRGSLDFGDVKENACMMVAFRDPQFPVGYVFKPCRLEGANDHERVLKPRDWNDRRDGQYRPVIGFTRDRPQAHIPAAGHRILKHSIHEQRHGGRRSDPSGYGAPPRHAAHIEQHSYAQGSGGGYRGYYESSKTTIYQQESTYGKPPAAMMLPSPFGAPPPAYNMPPPPIPPAPLKTGSISFAELAAGILPPPQPPVPLMSQPSTGRVVHNSHYHKIPAHSSQHRQNTYYNSSHQAPAPWEVPAPDTQTAEADTAARTSSEDGGHGGGGRGGGGRGGGYQQHRGNHQDSRRQGRH